MCFSSKINRMYTKDGKCKVYFVPEYQKWHVEAFDKSFLISSLYIPASFRPSYIELEEYRLIVGNWLCSYDFTITYKYVSDIIGYLYYGNKKAGVLKHSDERLIV